VKKLCGTYGRERKGVYRALVWKPEGKKPLENLGVSGVIELKQLLKE
jgi:hypothetical protein